MRHSLWVSCRIIVALMSSHALTFYRPIYHAADLIVRHFEVRRLSSHSAGRSRRHFCLTPRLACLPRRQPRRQLDSDHRTI